MEDLHVLSSYLLALQLIRSTFHLHSLCSQTSVQSITGKGLEDDFYSELTFSLVSLSRCFTISLIGLKRKVETKNPKLFF